MRLPLNKIHKTPQIIRSKRSFYLFEMIFNSIFITVIGIFVTLGLIFTSLSLIFFNPQYNQTIMFCILGVLVFSVSYKFFIKYNGHHLRNLDFEHFISARKTVASWFFWTLSTYLLFVWFILLLLGSTNGFNLKFPTSDASSALISGEAFDTKLLGIILLACHIFVLVIFKFVSYYWTSIAAFAFREFEKRRRMLEEARSKTINN